VLLGGVAALIAAAIAGNKEIPQRKKLVVGGVDLTDVDTSRPFIVNFSVPAEAHSAVKLKAIKKLEETHEAFKVNFPNFTLTQDVWIPGGRIVLHVQPGKVSNQPHLMSSQHTGNSLSA
jgi:hypothetical protein